ncbi:MAG: non-heme iron oxygenase ferredoxin subunit [Actinobacteria bacterium]|nr:non-heme iron oxygenase ferredoxin subunit [Actinomycetota bacterium]
MTVVCKFDDIESGTAKQFDMNGTPVAVVRIDDEVFAIGDICSHANVSLSDGEVWCDTKQLECPRHSSSFSLLTGVPETLPATQPVPVYVARVIDGNVDVEVGS